MHFAHVDCQAHAKNVMGLRLQYMWSSAVNHPGQLQNT